MWCKKLEDNQPFFTLNFLAKKEGNLSDALALNSQRINAEAYVEKNENFDFLDIKLSFEKEIELTEVSIFPNPFFEKTQLNFSLEKASEATLEIYDVNGRIIFSQQKNATAGLNQWEISKKELKENGIYYLKIKTANQVFSSKIVRK